MNYSTEAAMAKFLITYHGGEMPADPQAREQMMKAFAAWVGAVGDKMVDPGAPLGLAKTVTSAGVTDAEPGGIGGYTLLNADSLDDAVGLVRDHPFVGRGGTLRVSEAVAP
jgi:hypothetical protein